MCYLTQTLQYLINSISSKTYFIFNKKRYNYSWLDRKLGPPFSTAAGVGSDTSRSLQSCGGQESAAADLVFVIWLFRGGASGHLFALTIDHRIKPSGPTSLLLLYLPTGF